MLPPRTHPFLRFLPTRQTFRRVSRVHISRLAFRSTGLWCRLLRIVFSRLFWRPSHIAGRSSRVSCSQLASSCFPAAPVRALSPDSFLAPCCGRTCYHHQSTINAFVASPLGSIGWKERTTGEETIFHRRSHCQLDRHPGSNRRGKAWTTQTRGCERNVGEVPTSRFSNASEETFAVLMVGLPNLFIRPTGWTKLRPYPKKQRQP